MSKIKHFVNFHARKIFGAHIQSLNDQGSTLWDSVSKNSFKPLHSLYKRSLKLTLLKQSSLEQDDYNLLNILQLHTKLKYNKGICMQKILSGNATPSLTRLFPINSHREQTKINIPRPRIDLFKSSLTLSAASPWKYLPLSIKLRSNYSPSILPYQSTMTTSNANNTT